MSSNNQLIIRMNKKGIFEIHENLCYDNEMVFSKNTLLSKRKTLRHAIIFCNKYMQKNIVEYGYIIAGSCFKREGI